MKIAIDARIIRTTTGRYVERLLNYLQDIDTQNTYVILLDTKDFDSWQPTNPNFTKVAIDIPNYSVREQFGFAITLYRLKVDLVHFCMPQQPLLYFKPSVTTIHDLTLLHHKNYVENSKLAYDIKQAIFKGILTFAAHKSRRIITPTKYARDDVIKTLHAKPERISVTYEAADTIQKTVAEPIAIFESKPFIMYAGRTEPHKNIRRLILAHQQLLQTHPDLQLAIPGPKDGNNRMIEQWCKDEGYKQVHLLGFVSEGELRWLFENAQAYVFPSLSEGFGLPGLEAMSYGTPVVSSNATCLPEVYRDGAHYFNPEDVDDMASKINDVLTNSALRSDLIAKSKNFIASYSWMRMAKETLEVYTQAL